MLGLPRFKLIGLLVIVLLSPHTIFADEFATFAIYMNEDGSAISRVPLLYQCTQQGLTGSQLLTDSIKQFRFRLLTA